MRGSGDSPTPAEAGPLVRFIQTTLPDFVRRRIALKLALTMVVITLPLVAFIVGTTGLVTDHSESTVETEFAGDAERQAALVEQWQQGHQTEVEHRSANETYADGSPSIAEMREAATNVRSAHLLRDAGTGVAVVASSTERVQFDINDGADIDIGDLPGRDWLDDGGAPDEIATLSSHDVYTSDVYVDEGTALVGFVSPVTEDRYLLLEVRASSLETSFRGALPDDIGFTQVVTTASSPTAGADTVVFDGRPVEAVGGAYTNEDLLQRAAGGMAGSVTDVSLEDGGDAHVVGYAAVDDSDWVVLVHAPRSDLFGPIDVLDRWGLVVAGFGFLLVAIVGLAYGRSLSNAIRDLTGRTDQLLQGDFDTRFYTPRIDAIGGLCERLVTIRDRSQPADQTAVGSTATDPAQAGEADGPSGTSATEEDDAESSDGDGGQPEATGSQSDDSDQVSGSQSDDSGQEAGSQSDDSDQVSGSQSDNSGQEAGSQSDESDGGFDWVGDTEDDSEEPRDQ